MQLQTATTNLDVMHGGNDIRTTTPIVIGACCLVMILALVLGVGIPNHMILRHVVQTMPLWPALVLGFRRSGAAGWVALPVFLFWLVLMSLIWLYLLGVAHVLSGTFSPWEIAMTIVVGAAAATGIGTFVRSRSTLSAAARVAAFVVIAAAQFACLRISFLPAIAHR